MQCITAVVQLVLYSKIYGSEYMLNTEEPEEAIVHKCRDITVYIVYLEAAMACG